MSMRYWLFDPMPGEFGPSLIPLNRMDNVYVKAKPPGTMKGDCCGSFGIQVVKRSRVMPG